MKDTRLLIQTFADRSCDVIKRRYEFLKQKLDDDYAALTEKLQSSVDSEFTKLAAAISVEESKQSHADAVTSYVENSLATTSNALLIQEAMINLKPEMASFYAAHGTLEPLLTSQIHRFTKRSDVSDDVNMIGSIDSAVVSFDSRYVPQICEDLEAICKLGKNVEIDLGKEAKVYRLCIGDGKIMVCAWNISMLLIYNIDGSLHKQVDLAGKAEDPVSAAFISDSLVVVAADDGLIIVDVETSAVDNIVNTDCHADVFYSNDTIYALNITKKCVEIIRKGAYKWIVANLIALKIADMEPSATMLVTPSCVYVCNYNNKVFRCNFNGALPQTLSIDVHQLANTSSWICAADVDGRLALSVGGQLVIQHNDDSRVVKLEGVKIVSDIVFGDQHTFWILECVCVKTGKYRIIKYNI